MPPPPIRTLPPYPTLFRSSNTATIRSAEVQNPVPSNTGTVTVVWTPAPSPLTVLRGSDVTRQQPGGRVYFRLSVTDNGAGRGTRRTLSDIIPAGRTGHSLC